MPHVLHHVFYVSRSRATPLEVEKILECARALNAGRGLTGSLVFTGGHFAQWLEGPGEALKVTMAAIGADRRHEAVKILGDGGCPARRFAAWSMAYAEAAGADDLLASLLAAESVPAARVARLADRLFPPTP